MFAFAIIDRRAHELFCARDPFGQKPFFYRQLTASGSRSRSECRTFRRASRLPAGNRSRLDRRFPRVRMLPLRSLDLSRRAQAPAGALPDLRGWQAQRRALFRVRPCGASAGPAARRSRTCPRRAARSGRAQLSCRRSRRPAPERRPRLVARCSRFCAKLHPAVPLSTFTIRNVDRCYDESAAAARSRGRFRNAPFAKSRRRARALARIANELPALPRRAAGRSWHPAEISSICREIAKTTKVALTGDGGDEFFYGYAVFRPSVSRASPTILPAAVHHRVIRPLTQLLPASRRYLGFDLKAKQFAKGFPCARPPAEFLLDERIFLTAICRSSCATSHRGLGDVRGSSTACAPLAPRRAGSSAGSRISTSSSTCPTTCSRIRTAPRCCSRSNSARRSSHRPGSARSMRLPGFGQDARRRNQVAAAGPSHAGCCPPISPSARRWGSRRPSPHSFARAQGRDPRVPESRPRAAAGAVP